MYSLAFIVTCLLLIMFVSVFGMLAMVIFIEINAFFEKPAPKLKQYKDNIWQVLL